MTKLKTLQISVRYLGCTRGLSLKVYRFFPVFISNLNFCYPRLRLNFVSYDPTQAASVLKIIEDTKAPELLRSKKVAFIKSHMSGVPGKTRSGAEVRNKIFKIKKC